MCRVVQGSAFLADCLIDGRLVYGDAVLIHHLFPLH